jgi:hypothetical protein
MKKLAAVLVLAGVVGLWLAPPAAAGASTDAALDLGAFAVFNQLARGETVLSGIFAPPVIVPAPPPVVYAPPPVVYAPPAPVVVHRPTVIYPPRVYGPSFYGAPYGAPAYYGHPAYVRPPRVMYKHAPKYHAHPYKYRKHYRGGDRDDD